MSYKVGVEKKQISLMPGSLDDYIPAGHICRVISRVTVTFNLCLAPSEKLAIRKEELEMSDVAI